MRCRCLLDHVGCVDDFGNIHNVVVVAHYLLRIRVKDNGDDISDDDYVGDDDYIVDDDDDIGDDDYVEQGFLSATRRLHRDVQLRLRPI